MVLDADNLLLPDLPAPARRRARQRSARRPAPTAILADFGDRRHLRSAFAWDVERLCARELHRRAGDAAQADVGAASAATATTTTTCSAGRTGTCGCASPRQGGRLRAGARDPRPVPGAARVDDRPDQPRPRTTRSPRCAPATRRCRGRRHREAHGVELRPHRYTAPAMSLRMRRRIATCSTCCRCGSCAPATRSRCSGWAWSLLNPLSQMVIFTVIFIYVFKAMPPTGDPGGLKNFPLYFLSGLLPFNFFQHLRRHRDGCRAGRRRADQEGPHSRTSTSSSRSSSPSS